MCLTKRLINCFFAQIYLVAIYFYIYFRFLYLSKIQKMRGFMGRKIIIISLLLFSIFANAEFTVLNQNEDELTIKFTLPEYSFEERTINDEVFHQIMCDDSHYDTADGNPMVPYFNEIVGLPVDGDIHFRVLNKKQKTETGINLIPVERQILDESANESVFIKNNTVYNSTAYYPETLLQKGNSAFLSDRNYVGFSVNPFQYKALSDELLVTEEVIFKVLISGDKSISRDWTTSRNFIDEIGDSFFLNNDYSKMWRKEKEPSHYEPSRNADGKVWEIQIVVDEEGIYKITKDYLIDTLEEYTEENELEYEMGIDWDEINPRNLELRDEFGTIPINFVGENDGSFDEGDYFEFFGDRHYGDEGYMDDYTSENVYSLSLQDYLGSRMAVENGGLEVSDEYHPATNPDGYRIPDSFLHTLYFEEQFTKQHLGIGYEYNPDYFKEDIWFWQKINSPNLEIFQFGLQYPHNQVSKKFTASVCLFGSTYTLYGPGQPANPNILDHHAIVRINSVLINDHKWNGQREKCFESYEPENNSNLVHGINSLYISLPGLSVAPLEQVLLDNFSVTYWREYKTDTDYLNFTKPDDKPLGLYQFELSNFTEEDVSVYKLNSGIIENLQIESFFEDGEAPYIVTFQDSVLSENAIYCAVTEFQKKTPIFIKPNIPTNMLNYSLKDPANSSDYIVITTTEIANYESTIALKDFWNSKGIDTDIIDIQDIYDEFNSGIRSAKSIKDFISFSYHNWNTSPTHFAFLGDGISDERDNSIDRQYNLIPTKHIWADKRGAIASDNWFGCIIGDDLVNDVSISRINVWVKEQVDIVLNKTMNYSEFPNFEDLWQSSVTFAAGGNPRDSSFFAVQSERIKKKYIPESFNFKRIYCNTSNLPTEYFGNTITLQNSLNTGTTYLQFMGHGGGYVWADYNLLNLQNISSLINTNYSLVTSLSCYGGAFNSKRSSCIGEEFILTENGAIAHIGFSGYGYKTSDEYFGEHITNAIYKKRLSNIGAITNFTKAKMYADARTLYKYKVSLIHGCTLLGDAMNSIVLPIEEKQILLNDYHISPGDTLRFHCDVGLNFTSGKFVIYNEYEVPINEYFSLTLPVIDGTITSEFVIPHDGEQIYSGIIKLYAYSDDSEITGIAHFAVGQSTVNNISVIPNEPTQNNEINITAEFFDNNGISDIICEIKTWEFDDNPLIYYDNSVENPPGPFDEFEIQMTDVQNNTFGLTTLIPQQPAGYQVTFIFIITDTLGNETATPFNYFRVLGPELRILDYQISIIDNSPTVGVLIQNTGDIQSPDFYYRAYYGSTETLIDSIFVAGVEVTESRWEYITLPQMNTFDRLKLTINEDYESFDEYNLYYQAANEINTDYLDFNFFELGASIVNISSVDGNIECNFPADIVSEPTIFSISNIGTKIPVNQPDTNFICLADSSFSDAYQVLSYADSNFTINLGTMYEFKVYYNVLDTLTQENEDEDDFALLYHWEEEFNKWVFEKYGVLDSENDYVSFELDKLGIFTILYKTDRQAPAINANVEGQEFTHGGYVSRNGTISLVLSDRNGIDIFNNSIEIAMNGLIIDPSEYTMNVSPGNLTTIPIKYKLNNTEEDTYFMNINGTDINGNNSQKTIKFEVIADFNIFKIANYPNPVVSTTQLAENEGKTRFTYVLTDDADYVELRIYTVSGRLVKKFTNLNANIGYHEFPRSLNGWNCKDEDGFYLANGVYFYKFTAVKGEKKIEKTNKMAILK
jgi:hypothetical protein